jgi:uncharacterized zinc-type alcohol dehydrogenase-like protein
MDQGVGGKAMGAADAGPGHGARTLGYAARSSSARLRPMQFDRAAAGHGEIEIEILFCGVCHSDIHQVKNDWSNTVYPCMPGHEVVGRVIRTGPGATRHAVGDVVGIGCMISSCGMCAPCREGDQNYCEGPNGWLATYNGPTVPAKSAQDGRNIYGCDNTFGGYSTHYTVREDFALKIPPSLKPEVAAPILCAGVTTYSPMKHWGVKAGDHVGVIGFGGLGDMAVKLALAMGARVTVFTRTAEKLEQARRLGAEGVREGGAQELSKLANSFDFILSTVPEKHDLNPYIPLLKRDRTIVCVGALEKMGSYNNMQVVFKRKSIAGSLIGNLEDTQEVLDFCAEKGIGPDIEIIRMQEINVAMKRVEDGEVRFRYVIDMASLREEAAGA